MNRHPTSRAIARAQWLAELATALDEAERLLAQLITEGVRPFDSELLRLRLVELRKEIRRPGRIGQAGGRIIGSSWPVQASI